MVIAIGGSAIAVLSVVAWALLRPEPPAERALRASIVAAPPVEVAPGAHPIFRPADAEPAPAAVAESPSGTGEAAPRRASRSRDAADVQPGSPPLRKLVDRNPEYPRAARAAGTEGWVDVRFTVNPQGVPEDVRVFGAKPAGVFDAAAIEAVRAWRYAAPPAALDATERLRFALR